MTTKFKVGSWIKNDDECIGERIQEIAAEHGRMHTIIRQSHIEHSNYNKYVVQAYYNGWIRAEEFMAKLAPKGWWIGTKNGKFGMWEARGLELIRK